MNLLESDTASVRTRSNCYGFSCLGFWGGFILFFLFPIAFVRVYLVLIVWLFLICINVKFWYDESLFFIICWSHYSNWLFVSLRFCLDRMNKYYPGTPGVMDIGGLDFHFILCISRLYANALYYVSGIRRRRVFGV